MGWQLNNWPLGSPHWSGFKFYQPQLPRQLQTVVSSSSGRRSGSGCGNPPKGDSRTCGGNAGSVCRTRVHQLVSLLLPSSCSFGVFFWGCTFVELLQNRSCKQQRAFTHEHRLVLAVDRPVYQYATQGELLRVSAIHCRRRVLLFRRPDSSAESGVSASGP